MNDTVMMRWYALICGGCVLYTGKELYDAYRDGTLNSIFTWLLMACLLITAVYTGVRAWQLKRTIDQACRNDQDLENDERCDTDHDRKNDQGSNIEQSRKTDQDTDRSC